MCTNLWRRWLVDSGKFAALSIVLILVQALQSPSALAQSTDASVSGRVTDQSNAVVPDVEVELRNADTGVSQVTKTNGVGLYAFPYVTPGNYVMSVRKESFQTVSVTGITLNVQDNLSRNFVLQIGSSAESITVTAESVNLNTTDGAVSTIVDRQFVENIPLNGQSFQSLITLAPGVVAVSNPNGPGGGGEFSVNGQRAEANYFTVDGVSANTGSSPNQVPFGASGSLPAETALGTTQSLASLDDLQEFRVQTSSYSAEYGRTPGGQFSIITRSGTNAWHGSAFEYFRNDVLDANNWFNDAMSLPKPPERQNDFGGTLGGPIVLPHIYNGKDRTFFFFSYEGLRLRTPQPALTVPVPDSGLRSASPAILQPFLNAFPRPTLTNGKETQVLDANGQPTGLALFTATYSNPSTLDATSIRIDHNFTPNFKAFGRYNTVPSNATVRAHGDLAEFIATTFQLKSLTLGATNVLFKGAANDFRFNFTQHGSAAPVTLDTFGGAVPYDIAHLTDSAGQPFPKVDDLNFVFPFGGFIGNEYGSTTVSTQRQLNIVDTFGTTFRSHSLKFGVDYRRLVTPLQPRKIGVTALFSSAAAVLQNSATVIPYFDSSIPLEPIYKNFSLFAQDEWKVASRLALSLGLRWDVNPAPTDAHGNNPYTLDQTSNLATTKIAAMGTPLWKTTYGNFAPRVGVAYQARQSQGRETVLRVGFGLFYDLGSTFGSQGYLGGGFGNSGFLTNVPFPVTAAQLQVPAPSINPPNFHIYAFDPSLKLPYTLQWNIAVEQSLGKNQAITASYVGAAGRRLLLQRFYDLSSVNPLWAPLSGSGPSVSITNNRATSNYESLQIQYQRKLSSGFQALISYTWSHALDDASTNLESDSLLRGNSDFDIRHNLQAALTYDIPGHFSSMFARNLLQRWSLDTRLTARSATPLDIIAVQAATDATGTLQNIRADVVPGVPQYLHDPTAPGGRVINFNAFSVPTTGFGNASRNSLRAFDSWQADLAVRREFPIHERLRLQFRAEAFNLFNHPNFANINNLLSSGPQLFGRAQSTLNNSLGGLSALYQVGGPRSMQLALKLQF